MLPKSVPGHAIDGMCADVMTAVTTAAESIAFGHAQPSALFFAITVDSGVACVTTDVDVVSTSMDVVSTSMDVAPTSVDNGAET